MKKQHSNFYSKLMRAVHSNLQRQNTMYSHKKYVILQHLLLMRLIVDTRQAKSAKRLCFTCGARKTQTMISLGPVRIKHMPRVRLRFTCTAREAEAFGTKRKPCIIYSAFMRLSSESLVLQAGIFNRRGKNVVNRRHSYYQCDQKFVD